MNKLELVSRLTDNTYNPVSKSGTYSLKSSMQGNRLVLKFQTIVHFASETALRPQIQNAKEHAIELIKEFMSNLKKDYKKKSDETLTLKDMGGDDNIEVIQSTSNSLRKVAYYRYNQNLDIE